MAVWSVGQDRDGAGPRLFADRLHPALRSEPPHPYATYGKRRWHSGCTLSACFHSGLGHTYVVIPMEFVAGEEPVRGSTVTSG